MKPPRNFHIRCDLEGVSGVVHLHQVDPSSPAYSEGRALFMAELLALIDGLRLGGASEISIYDEHWFGRNIDLLQIPRGVRVISGKPPYRCDWAGGLNASHAGMILHGLHSMAGSGQLLAHTYEPDFTGILLNGRPVGEIGVETAIAGDVEVPLALVIADSAGAEEAVQLVPGVATVVTKVSQSEMGAECFPLADNVEAIRAAAVRLAREGTTCAPWRVPGPVEMRCSFSDGVYLEKLRAAFPDDFISTKTLKLNGPTVIAVWADYWQRKLLVQRSLSAAAV